MVKSKSITGRTARQKSFTQSLEDLRKVHSDLMDKMLDLEQTMYVRGTPSQREAVRKQWNELNSQAEEVYQKIRSLEDDRDTSIRKSQSYKNAVEQAEAIRADRAHVRQREREVTSATYERAKKRQSKEVSQWFRR